MSMAAGLFALVLLGSDGPPAPPGAVVTYQIRFLEMRGLDWRGEVHGELTPVARQGGASIWTAPASLAATLEKRAAQTLGTPKVTAQPATDATIRAGTRHAYVADLKRVADGPVGHARALAYQPQLDHVDDMISLTLCGRWVDQGLMTEVAIEETRLAGLETFTIREEVRGDEASDAGPEVVNAQVQVPQVVEGHVSGEWLIPRDGLLVVSLGAHAKAGDDGKATPHERLALIEPVASPTGAEVSPSAFARPGAGPLPIAVSSLGDGTNPIVVGPPTPAPPRVACFVAAPTAARGIAYATPPAPPAAAALPTPPPPSRVLPTPINDKGEVVPLPPLPEDVEPVVEDDSAEPRPAPQSRLRDRPVPGSIEAPEPAADDRAVDVPAGRAELKVGLGSNGLTIRGEIRLDSPRPDADAAARLATKLLSTFARRALAEADLDVEVGPARHECPEGRTCCARDCDAPSAADQVAAALRRYARGGPEAEGRVCVFELRGEGKNGRSGRLAVYVEADEAGRALLATPAATSRGDDVAPAPSACPPAAEAVESGPRAGGEAKASGDDAPPCPDAAGPQASRAEVWGLSLPEAVRLGLENAMALKVVAVGAGVVPSPTILACRADGDAPAEVRARAQAVARSIEGCYWGLAQAQAAQWAAESAAELAEQCLRRTRAACELGAATVADVREARAACERFRREQGEATEALVLREAELRQILGLSPHDPRRLAATSRPEAERVAYDWESCRGQLRVNHPELLARRAAIREAMLRLAGWDVGVSVATSCRALIREAALCRQVVHQATHQLARSYLEVEAGYNQYQTAQKLKRAALARLEAQRGSYDEGTVPAGRYLEAVRRWAVAVTLEAEMLARYNTAIAALEETKGTLLEREGIEVVEEPSAGDAPSKRDGQVGRALHATAESGPTRRLAFGLTPVPVLPVARAEPLLIRLPVGRFGVVEIAPLHSKPTWIGAFW